MSNHRAPWRPKTARALAVLGMVLLGIGLLLGVFGAPVRAPQIVLVALMVFGTVCVAASLVLAELARR